MVPEVPRKAADPGADHQNEADDIYSARDEEGDLHGDAIFRHPFVQKLLAKGRAKVAEALAALDSDSSCSSASSALPCVDTPGRWLICVRTYGRSGNPEGYKPRAWSRKFGIGDLTLSALESVLGAAEAARRCLIFVSHEDPDWTSGRLLAHLRGTVWENRIVCGIKGADLQVRFMESCCPKGMHMIVADDNIKEFITPTGVAGKQSLAVRRLSEGDAELRKWIDLADQVLRSQRSKVWSVNPSANHFLLHSVYVTAAKRMRTLGQTAEETALDFGLGLVYGAFFGMLVQHDPRRYTRYGGVKDDVERTLRYFHIDKSVMRIKTVALVKTHKPGVFGSCKGGISANLTEEKHRQQSTTALQKMIDEFADPYIKFPPAGRRAPCGVYFCRQKRRWDAEGLKIVKVKNRIGRPRKKAREEAEEGKADPARELKNTVHCRVQLEQRPNKRWIPLSPAPSAEGVERLTQVQSWLLLEHPDQLKRRLKALQLAWLLTGELAPSGLGLKKIFPPPKSIMESQVQLSLHLQTAATFPLASHPKLPKIVLAEDFNYEECTREHCLDDMSLWSFAKMASACCSYEGQPPPALRHLLRIIGFIPWW